MSRPILHPTSVCETDDIGEGVVIGSHVSIEAGTRIGNGVTIRNGVHLYRGTVVEDGVQIGTNASFAVERPLGDSSGLDLPIILKNRCVIGANATLCAGVTIGERSVVDAGAVVTRSVQPLAIVSGNPARVIGFAGATSTHFEAPKASNGLHELPSKVKGVRVLQLPFVSDPRGNLTVGEFERSLPFLPKRYFVTFDIPNASIRGEHAHRECEQFLVCVRGSCAVVVDDGLQREEYILDRPNFGVYVPPMVWATEYKHSTDSTLLVFASHYYDPADYIRDYADFLAEARSASVNSTLT